MVLYAGLPELVHTPRVYPRVLSCIVFVCSLLLRCMFEV